MKDNSIFVIRGSNSTNIGNKKIYCQCPLKNDLTNFDSFIPISYKKGLINTLLFRYFNISSSYAIFDAEVEKFKKIMSLNGYPEKFLKNRHPCPSLMNPKGLFFLCFPF